MVSIAVSLAKVDLSLLFSKQMGARYLKWDKILIKIGIGNLDLKIFQGKSGKVEIIWLYGSGRSFASQL